MQHRRRNATLHLLNHNVPKSNTFHFAPDLIHVPQRLNRPAVTQFATHKLLRPSQLSRPQKSIGHNNPPDRLGFAVEAMDELRAFL